MDENTVTHSEYWQTCPVCGQMVSSRRLHTCRPKTEVVVICPECKTGNTAFGAVNDYVTTCVGCGMTLRVSVAAE